MEFMQAAGLIFDASFMYLDHLAPFCSLFEWPLIICEPQIAEQAHLFYPDVQVLETNAIGLGRWIQNRFTHIVSCSPRSLLTAVLGPTEVISLWLPHGNSDKGHIVPYFKALQEDDIALVYGQKMIDSFLEGGAGVSHLIRVGQFRYLHHHMRKCPIRLPFAFERCQRTVLYAPTWEDFEGNCSFWKVFPTLAQHLPDEINLIVKPHPNSALAHAPEFERLQGKTVRGNLQFVFDFPPIFPLLEICDIYLGDRSSIGYDYLLFDKPLFFFDPHDHPLGRDLLTCGRLVEPDTSFQKLSDPDRLSPIRTAMFAYAFDRVPYEELRRRVHALDGRQNLY